MAVTAPATQFAPGVVRFYQLMPAAGGVFRDAVLDGLAQPVKSIPPLFLFDEVGSRLHADLCDQPEYYAARIESVLLAAHIGDIVRLVGPQVQLIDLGGEAGARTRLLLEHLRPSLHVPVDVEPRRLRATAAALTAHFPELNIVGISADPARALALPEFVGVPIRRKLAYLPGGAIGRFTPLEAEALLARLRRQLGPGGVLLVGVDLAKDPAVLQTAFNDAAGFAARLRLNLLTRINRELQGDFQLARWTYHAEVHADRGWVQTRLLSGYAQFARVAGQRFDFRPGEAIATGGSLVYEPEAFDELARRAGFGMAHCWMDANRWYALFALAVA